MKSPESGNRQIETSRVTSLGQTGGESGQQPPPPLPMATEYCIDILRDLNNTFAAVLMNAQVLDGKMPSYSRSKRYVHEIERSAQRGGALLKRLLDRLAVQGSGEQDTCDTGFESGTVPPVAERTAVVASQGPNAVAEGELDFAPSAAAHAAPDFGVSLLGAHRRV